MKNHGKRLPGKGWRVLSFIPAFNWISLLYIGIINFNQMHIICAVIYGVITYACTSLSALMWIIGIVHYAIAYGGIKKQLNSNINTFDGMNGDMMVHSQSINCKPVGVNTYDGLDIKQDEVKKEEFSDVEIFGEQESRQAIPARPSYEQEGFRISFSVDKQREKFFRDMKKYSSKEGKKVLFVPFMTYWPTYDSMDGQQQAWYFYWRSQVREENYIDTGLSYIFVYIYELLSGIGWTAPQEGLVKLSSIWTRYRERFSKLDRYMPDWIFDFTQLHKLEYMSPVEKDYIHLMPSVVTDILIDRHSEEVPLKLSFSLIETLTDYAIVNSKFYKDGNQELIKEAIPRVIALVDVVLRKKKQKGILAIYGPSRTKKQARYIFSSAVCPQANEEFVIVVKGYSTNSKLRAYINELVRYGENVLRGLRGYRGRLRGITLDEEIAKLIEAFLKKEYGEHPEAKLEELSKKEIVLDFQSIDHLRAQSDAVRIALEVEDSVVTEEKPLLTDVAEVTEIYLALSPTAREILNRLEKSGWESKKLPEDEKAIQEINRLAERYLGCMLIASENENIIVEDDYRDELEYIYGNPPQILEQGNGKELFNVNELPVELKEFVEALMPDQKDVLHVLLTSKNPQSDLERISEKVMMMPEILVDDINALAMQLLGDIIIDTMEVEPVIIQEYLIPLKKSII